MQILKEIEKSKLDLLISELNFDIGNTSKSLLQELNKITVGRPKAEIFDLFKIECYRTTTSLSNLASISIIDYHHVVISLYDKSLIKVIEKTLHKSDLEVNPQTNGDKINIYFPQITEERRNSLSKIVNDLGEKAKIAIRNVRRSTIKEINDLPIGKDMIDSYLKIIEKIISQSVDQIENTVSLKLNELRM